MIAPYGSWPSPLVAADIAAGGRRPDFPSIHGETVWWQEVRALEDGRGTIMRRDVDGSVTEVLPPPWSARTRVQEYGGRSYLPVQRDGAWHVVFSEASDQRLYLLPAGSTRPEPLTPEPPSPGGVRFADLQVMGEDLVCVREEHTPAVRRSIVTVPLSGAAATDPALVRELHSGADFFASPTPSPDGARLAWIAWSHPRMPWDGTELRVGTVPETGPLTGVRTLKGGISESVLAPQWRDSSTLYCLSDWPGWWNLYQVGLTMPAMSLHPAEEEFAAPPWRLGTSPYQVLSDGRIALLHGDADLAAAILDPDSGELTPIAEEYTSWSTLASDGTSVVGVAGSPTVEPSIVRLSPETGTAEILRGEAATTDPSYLPTPEPVELSGRYGTTIHATIYPPTNPNHVDTGPAPYVVWVHGGPTTASTTALRTERAYFTSRGIGVAEVNYGGSSGFGRSYRQRLKGQWGVVDVEDAVAAARSLIDRGVADADRIAVRGGSAGGFTALLALTDSVFACGVSQYGVTDLLRLARETHDFESRYPDSLVGPLPGYAATYTERSPITRAGEVSVPVLLLQGSEDPVVPPSQATEFAEALAANSVRYAYIEFEGEPHGFLRADNRARALEAELAFYGEVFGFDPPEVPPITLTTDPPPAREQEPAAPSEPEDSPSTGSEPFDVEGEREEEPTS
ncbi:S9 family peptidase [Spiractinospora alimapuensis]|nr:prolyl oligopeptidase family serine peptidase [Spiractinospora alimapuensis]QVQ54757.1 S9 family peptidase [Spiractinospora alimapuensis]